MPHRVCIFLYLPCAIVSFMGLAFCKPVLAQDPAGDRIVIHGPVTVADAIRIGLRENLTVRANEADARAASADVKVARSMTVPQLSATSYLTAGDATNIVGSSPGVIPANNMLAPPKAFADQNITLMAPLYTGGRLQSLVRGASDRRSAAGSMVTGSQADVALAIKTSYDRVLLGSSLVDVAQARVTAASELLRNVTDRFQAGKDIEASVARVQAELADAQREVTNAANDRAKAELDLRAAMGVSLDSDFTTSGTLMFTPVTGDLAYYLQQAAQNRPELLAAEAEASAARHDVSAAHGSLQPQVYGFAMADAFAAQSMPSGKGGTVGVAISIPLFDAGQRRAELERSAAVRDRQEAKAKDAGLVASNAVRQAWLDVQTAAQNHVSAEAGLVAAQSSFEITQMRVQAQKGIMVEQLDAVTALTKARANSAQALFEHETALARLERAIGGVK